MPLPHLRVLPLSLFRTGRPIYLQSSLFILVNFPLHFPTRVLAKSITVSLLNAEWAMPPPPQSWHEKHIRLCLAFHMSAGVELGSSCLCRKHFTNWAIIQPFRVLCYLWPKICLLINANCSLHLITFIPNIIAHKNPTYSVSAILLSFPLCFRVKIIAS